MPQSILVATFSPLKSSTTIRYLRAHVTQAVSNQHQIPGVVEIYRHRQWSALGDIVHYLQDMDSPQHVRSDYHCNALRCALLDLAIPAGLSRTYKLSAYETYHEQPAQMRTIRALAASATAPMLFGLPREFWNVNTTAVLTTTTNPSRIMQPHEGIAAYTSTNFTSMGKNFTVEPPRRGTPLRYLPADGLPFPKPSQTGNSVNVRELFPNRPETLELVRTKLCAGSLDNCAVTFWD
jgi:hypothetical protein